MKIQFQVNLLQFFLSLSVTFISMIPREASHPRSEITIFSKFPILREKCTWMYVDRCLVPVRRFPSPSRSIHFAWTTRPETLWLRGINVDSTARQKHDSDSYATRDSTIDVVTATAKQIYDISGWQSQWRHRLWRRVASRFLGNATSTGYKGQNVRSSFSKNVYCWWITTDSRQANNV